MANENAASFEESGAEDSGRKKWCVSQGAYGRQGGAEQAAPKEPGDAGDDTAKS
jgi:hypothetical protein